MVHAYNKSYTKEHLTRSGFPLGGMGAGMIALESSGKLAQVSIRHQPAIFFEPLIFSAIHVRGVEHGTRVLEGPPPDWKLSSQWLNKGSDRMSSGSGLRHKTYGFPLFESTTFTPRFPFAQVGFEHASFPLSCCLTAFSPFIPTDSDHSSLPVASLTYTFTNPSEQPLEAVYSFHSSMLIEADPESKDDCVLPYVMQEPDGFVLIQPAAKTDQSIYGEFSAQCDLPQTSVDCAWFRGGWIDALTMLMSKITSGDTTAQPPSTESLPGTNGGSLYVPLKLNPGESRNVTVRLAWYVPFTRQRFPVTSPQTCDCDSGECQESDDQYYKPWYASRFTTGSALRDYWQTHHDDLKSKSTLFSDTFFASTLPAEVTEAVAANLSILKSPTVMRQHDGRLWAWEGCSDETGCCYGNCTHVWNYAQAMCHLFPDMERTLRETELTVSQSDQGKQAFRSVLPISTPQFDHHAAADGQLGGLLKLYRDWRICADDDWLNKLWPSAVASIDYCIQTWDPDETGLLVEPHHNTYDIEFWGPDGMCSSFYLGALKAMTLMANALGQPVERYDQLYARGKKAMEDQLFNGAYFFQQIRWKDLHTKLPHELNPQQYSDQALAILKTQGPKYQYGKGCLADGILGAWIAKVCGLDHIIDTGMLKSHLQSVFRYNFRDTLVNHINPQRSTYALGSEAGLLLCTWPKGGRLSLPFPYSEEVFTGVEYQVASHLMMMGCVDEGLTLVRGARDRYNGIKRNPFNEIECGHWYARAMSSYGLIQGLSGARYDAVEKTLYVHPSIPGDFKSFLSTATGFGLVKVENDKVMMEVVYGKIDIARIDYVPCTISHD